MVNGVGDSGAAAGDLALQRGDARFQFGDGERVDILADQRVDPVAGAPAKVGQGVVDLHGMQR